MAKFIYLLYINFLYLYNISALGSHESKHVVSSTSIDELPDNCQQLLQLFAQLTANFTLCIVSNARPITVCKSCSEEFKLVRDKYEDIQKLNSDTKEDCRALLTSIDRLQVVFASYNYVLDMWNKASCELCLNGTVLNDRTIEVINYANQLDNCIKHETNVTICSNCKTNYEELINDYNLLKIEKEFCMDIIDLINITQHEWNSRWNCHVPNNNSEWMLFFISFLVLLMPILFYFINWYLSKERSNVILSQNRWHERFTRSASSTSGYIIT